MVPFTAFRVTLGAFRGDTRSSRSTIAVTIVPVSSPVIASTP